MTAGRDASWRLEPTDRRRRPLAEASRALDDARHEVRQAYREAQYRDSPGLERGETRGPPGLRRGLGVGRWRGLPCRRHRPRPRLARRPRGCRCRSSRDAGHRGRGSAAGSAGPAGPHAGVVVGSVMLSLPGRTRRPPPAIDPDHGRSKGDISATEERAEPTPARALRAEVTEWLEPEVPRTWTPPTPIAPVAWSWIRDINPIEKHYGTMYEAELKADFSPERRDTLVKAYHREVVQHRLVSLGGILGFVLICLAAVSGYIRADEATKGYYTNRLADAGRRGRRGGGGDPLSDGGVSRSAENPAMTSNCRKGRGAAGLTLRRIGKRPGARLQLTPSRG